MTSKVPQCINGKNLFDDHDNVNDDSEDADGGENEDGDMERRC